METKTLDILNSKSLKVFIKGLLVLIGLFFVLSCGVVTLLVLRLGANLECKVFALILTLVGLPIIVFLIVFLGFSCLVKSYYERLYGSSDNEGSLIRMHDINAIKEVYRMAIKAKNIIQKDMMIRRKRYQKK